MAAAVAVTMKAVALVLAALARVADSPAGPAYRV